MLPISIDTFMRDLGARVGVSYTEEQMEFMKDFTSPLISFSSPGTGKTKSAIGGLLTAELYHQIPGSQIYAISFTNMSTSELAIRHKKDCEAVGIRQTVNFSTLHSLCSRILKENYALLGFRKLEVASTTSIAAQAELLLNQSRDRNIKLFPWQVRPVIHAIRSLNSSLIFDRAHVESKYAFKQCKLPYEDFTTLRKFLYMYAKMTDQLQVQDILLYTLELLLSHPEVSQNFKKQCRVLVVDEFQDLSLLQLRIISLLSDNVIAIGDIKQQIYAFNGACQEIVEEFKKYFPNARERNLNQSFRCSNSIVEYSKKIIRPNRMQEEDFKGVDRVGTVRVVEDLSLEDICEEIEQSYRANRNTFPRDILFLFRNNHSAIPIAEELYRRRIPFRVNNYKPACQIPVIKELCEVIELALNDADLHHFAALRYILPEAQRYKDYTQMPIYKVCAAQGCSLLEAPYQFQDAASARAAMELLLWLQDKLAERAPVRELFNAIYQVFYPVYLKERENYMEMSASYYRSMARPLVQTKTYHAFIQDELAKVQAIQSCNDRRYGVRCYTFHASKGLEADDVYLLDAEDTIIPNAHKLDDLEKVGCLLEKAREVRNERSLLFVAATRARETLTVSYTKKLTNMLTDLNVYENYDTLYTMYKDTYPDVEAFESFYTEELPCQRS